MFEMASPSSPSLGYVHNCPDHASLDSNRCLPPTYSSKSHSQTPLKPRKSNLKEPTNENRLVDERKTSSSSSKVSNQHRNCISFHDDVPPSSPLMSRRQARVLDQWAAQQARETITTIERQKHNEFDISSISDSNYVSFRSRPASRETSPSPSDSSVSSLVQKWREFEISDVKQPPNNATPTYQYHNEGGNSGASSILVSRANSTTSEQENESLNNWEPEQTYAIDNYNKNINGGPKHKDLEKDKIRVMDIIKRLPLVECDKANTVCSAVVLSSPRIRGRQAVAALFAKQERDRYSEIEATSKRQAVSKFPKRGPLQTMLKLRALRREVSSEEDQSLQESSRVYELNKLKLKTHASSSSSINNIREKFNSSLSECDDSWKTMHTAQDDKLTTTNSAVEEAFTSNKALQTTKVINKKSNQEEKSSPQFDQLTSNHKKTNQVEIINTTKASLKNKNQEKEKEEEGNMEKMGNMSSSQGLVPQITTLHDVDEKEDVQPKMIISSNIVWSKTRNCDEHTSCIPLETNNVSSYVGWEDQRICEEEEQEGVYDDYDLCGPYLDWINDVSKPRSYWESLRQAWYAEIFTSSSKNEIRQLIERGSVSNVLASDFPEKMDRIMTSSCTRRQAKSGGCDREDESELQVAFTQNKMKPLSIHIEEEKQDHQDIQEHRFILEEGINNVEERIQEVGRENDVGGNEDVEEDPESSSSNQYNNGGFYDEQAQASSSLLPWTNYDNQEESDNSEQFEPTPHQEQSSITNSFDQDTQGGSSSCKNNSSIEMELIYDFRAHMEQMYREISELRMSVNSCVDMQAKLQNSIRDEVLAILSHNSGSKKTKRKESICKAHEKGCCCICYEKKVDSVLYRCGHMCACFKCAHELQWSSGKCPVCRAQIVDVVRVYTEDA